MPCAKCGAYENNPSWHPCDRGCVRWNPDNQVWQATLHRGAVVRCSASSIIWRASQQHHTQYYWFFYCAACKSLRDESHVLRGARVVIHPGNGSVSDLVDYCTDSSNATEPYWDSESATHSSTTHTSMRETLTARDSDYATDSSSDSEYVE